MAGIPQLGALPANEPQPSAPTPATPAYGSFGIPSYTSAPSAGRQQGIGEAGYAVGGIYDAYKKAQIDNVTQQTQLSAAARQRLTQLWEAGTNNPNIQQDPRMLQQIHQLYKTSMGTDPPLNAQGQLDWNSLAPVKNLAELPPATLEWLQQQTPQARRNFVTSNHIIGADEGWLNAPQIATPQQKVAVMNEFQKLIGPGGTKGMTAPSLQAWVKANGSVLDQALGQGTSDGILTNPDLFSSIQTQATASLNKINDTIAEIQARTKSLNGLTPDKVAQIKLDSAKAKEATSLADLDGIKTKYVGAQLQAYPQLVQAQIASLNSNSDQKQAEVMHIGQVVSDLQTSGGSSPRGMLQKALTDAQKDYKTAATAYTSAFNSGLGIPEEVKAAYKTAHDNLDTLNGYMNTINSEDFQKSFNAANAQRKTGMTTQSTGSADNFTWRPSLQDSKGLPIGPNKDGKWVHADGSPSN